MLKERKEKRGGREREKKKKRKSIHGIPSQHHPSIKQPASVTWLIVLKALSGIAFIFFFKWREWQREIRSITESGKNVTAESLNHPADLCTSPSNQWLIPKSLLQGVGAKAF